MDEETLEIRAVEVTTSNVGDAPMLMELLEQIPPNQGDRYGDRPLSAAFCRCACRAVDGAYDTRRCRNVIAARGAAALAIVLEPMAHQWLAPTA